MDISSHRHFVRTAASLAALGALPCTATPTLTVPPLVFRQMSWSPTSAPPPWCRRAMPVPIISLLSAGSSCQPRARASLPLCTLRWRVWRVFQSLNCSIFGYAQPEAAARALAENADMVLGVKVRMSENVIARHGTDWSRCAAPSRPVSCQAFLQKSCAILAVSLIGN